MHTRELAVAVLFLTSGIAGPAQAASVVGSAATSGDRCASLSDALSPYTAEIFDASEARVASDTGSVSAFLVATLDCGLALVDRDQEAAGEPEPSDATYGPPRGSVEFTCRDVTMTVTPDFWEYQVVVFAVDTLTGDRMRAVFGPFSGTIVEPVGDEIVLTRVELVVQGETIAAGSIPERCDPVHAID